MMNPFQGQVALVTGASRGIGAAIADRLAALGAIVIGTATTDAGATAISERLQAMGGQGQVLDVTQAPSIPSLVATIRQSIGPIGILVNNAGITEDTLLMRMTDAQWHATLATNLSSIYQTCRAVLRDMTKARQGRIINIASVVALTGNAGQTNYAAAKAGMIGFSKSLAKEVGSRGITVNVVAPGFIDTDMTRGLSEQTHQQLLSQIPLGRLGSAEEVAHVVAFLASHHAAYLTGETIHVNGGMYMP